MLPRAASRGDQRRANAKCAAQFAGSTFCTVSDISLANPTTGPSSGLTWVAGYRSSDAQLLGGGTCSLWTSSAAGTGGYTMSATGVFSSQTAGCNTTQQLACCRQQ